MSKDFIESDMWQCPKCGRSFRNTNQHHFCEALADTIDGYIEQSEYREILTEIRETIRTAATTATEKMAWKMPTYWQGENLIHFAAYKKYVGLTFGVGAIEEFADRIADTGYEVKKNTIQIPWDKPMPYDLITDMTQYCVVQAELKRG